MTTLVDKVNEYYTASGGAACTQQYMTGRSASDLYNGTARPELWMIVLAVVDPDEAAALVMTLLKSFQGQATGAFHADLMSVGAGSSDWDARRTRARKRDRGQGSESSLQNGYLHALEFLRTREPKIMQHIGSALLQCDVHSNGKTLTEARASLYTLLRAEVDEPTFKGEYT